MKPKKGDMTYAQILCAPIPYPAPAEPHPHVWKVGDYALCTDGKIHKVRQVEGYRLYFYDYGSRSASVCTPVPEPERPELPRWMEPAKRDGELYDSNSGHKQSLAAWIQAFNDGYRGNECDLALLLALTEWRKLTGRDM
jgi:hypothetical protein